MRYGITYGGGGANAPRAAIRTAERLAAAGRDFSIFRTYEAGPLPQRWLRYTRTPHRDLASWLRDVDVWLLFRPESPAGLRAWADRTRIVYCDIPGMAFGMATASGCQYAYEVWSTRGFSRVPQSCRYSDMLWEPGCPDLSPEPRPEAALVTVSEYDDFRQQLSRLDATLRPLLSGGWRVTVLARRSRLHPKLWSAVSLWRRVFRGRLRLVPGGDTETVWRLATRHSIHFQLQRRDGVDWHSQIAAQAGCAVFAPQLHGDPVLGDSNSGQRLSEAASAAAWEQQVAAALEDDRLAQAVAAVEYSRVRRSAAAEAFRRFLERIENE